MFDNFDNAFILFNKIKNGEIMLKDAKTNQNRFRSDLNEIKKKEILNNIKWAKKCVIQY